MNQKHKDQVMEDMAKEIVYQWGYEHEDWWKPIKEALGKAVADRDKEIFDKIVKDVDMTDQQLHDIISIMKQ